MRDVERAESLKEASDIKLEGLVHRTMADIYSKGCLFANALDSYAKAKACFDAFGLGYYSAILHFRKLYLSLPTLLF